jgi:hypothetical protein
MANEEHVEAGQSDDMGRNTGGLFAFFAHNWFKVGALLAIILVGLSVSYYFLVIAPVALSGRFPYRKVQDSEVLAVVPAGYRLAQLADRQNEVNYIAARLEDSKDDLIVVLLEWARPQLPVVASAAHPVMIKILKFSHESDRWYEYTKTVLGDHTNIRFSYKLITLDADRTDKLVVFPFFYALTDFVYDSGGNPTALKPDATMHQSVAVLQLKGGEIVDMIRYGHGSPMLDNVTADGGVDSMMVGADGSLLFGDFVKPVGVSWKGCYPIRYRRFFFNKDAAEFLVHEGAFVPLDEYVTKARYTGDPEHVSDSPSPASGLEKCRFIIFAGSAIIDEVDVGSIPESFLTRPRDAPIVGAKEK